ncbi:hypothetical protein CTAYLR_004332 [Chrysophaeum taylorii]|uniref:Tetratricopeptide repeat protein n=1 Tax=Chrysophaeum taylorii TaxID=2483200 RepID=A0AAD7XMU3_9STRA|nr:hypothetical protein CTAYLR_004332 [Chrysophaeum taylorii]
MKITIDNELVSLRDAIRFKPKDADAHFDVARYLSKRDRPREALIYYRRTVALRPEDAEAANNLGVTLFRTGDHEAAHKILESAARRFPDHGVIHLNLGLATDALARHKAACVIYRRAADLLSSSSSRSVAYHAMGFALERTGFAQEAIDAYREGLRCDADNVSCRDDLRFALAIQRRDERKKTKRGGGDDDDDEVRALDRVQQERDQPFIHPAALAARLQQRLAQLGEELRELPRECQNEPTRVVVGRDKPVVVSCWKPPGPGVDGFHDDRNLPVVGIDTKRRVCPQLAPTWRAKRRIRHPADLIHNGDYVPPRPAYLDPLGDVPRPEPIFARRLRPATSSAAAAAIMVMK